MASVLITGASGFVGRSLCRRFAAAGYTVIAAVNRTPVSDPAVRPLAIGDIADVPDWSGHLHGIDVVVHAAARAHVMGRSAQALAEFRRVNSQATMNLARASAVAGVRRFMYLSSVKVLGETSGAQPLRETDAPRPQDAYAISKYEAEEALRDSAKLGAMQVCVLRPPLVYGAEVKANFLSLLRLVDSPWPLPLGAATNRRSLIYVENLADACVRAASLDGPIGTWLVGDSESLSVAELIAALRRNLGRPRRLLPVPTAVTRGLGWILGKGATVQRLVDALEVDCSRFRREFGWSPPYALDAALSKTVSWYQRQGAL